ncbi:MAG: hypothetical protein ACREDR_41680 [Blastocatellia bacterium]
MLIAAFIFVMAVAALLQFGVWSWRAGLLRGAALEHSFSLDVQSNPVAQILLESQDFPEVMGYQKLCPELGGGSGLRAVSLYYRLVRMLGVAGDMMFPSVPAWAGREMALCTRYAAVVMVRRLERNQTLATQARSY